MEEPFLLRQKILGKKSTAQGSVEYLVVIAIVIVISLVVVGLMVTQMESGANVSNSSSEIKGRVGTDGFSVVDAIAGVDGNGVLVLNNNSIETLTVDKITIDGVDHNYDQQLGFGDSLSFKLGDLIDCNSAKKSYDLKISYTSASGLEKTADLGLIDFDCQDTTNPSGIVIEETVAVEEEEEEEEGGGEPIGEEVEFTKTDYGEEEDCITENVCINRLPDGGGLYNSVTDETYTGLVVDTEWSFVGSCEDSLFLKGWMIAIWDDTPGGEPPDVLDLPGCLHLITDDLYYNITMTSWTEGGSGGGFSYTRQQVTSIIPWEPLAGYTYFEKTNYGAEEDCITDTNVCITRGEDEGIYNSFEDTETSFANSSPADTEWSFEGYCESVTGFDDWMGATSNAPPESVGTPGCVHLISDDEYYSIIFRSWSNGSRYFSNTGNGGGFSYYRKQVSAIAPTAPSSLTTTAIPYLEIDLTWTDNSDTELGFKIERSENEVDWEEVATVENNVESYEDTLLQPSTNYYYRVYAYNYFGDSSYSNTDDATTEAFSEVFCSGAGTSTNPWGICDCGQLQSMGADLDGNFALKQNIDCSETTTWNVGAGFEPIGTDTNEFSGNFDGNNYVIQHLYINRSTTDYVGLFGESEGLVYDVGIEDVNIFGGDYYVGALMGWNQNNDINNSYSTGLVKGNRYVGGLVGYTNGGEITYSYSTSTVEEDETCGSNCGYYMGGLVGYCNSGSITNSYSNGNVTGYSQVGGLVGGYTGTTLSDSYATGAISSAYYSGGLVGVQSGGTISDSYATGNVSTSIDYVGGLVGLQSGGTLSDSYAVGDASGRTYVGGLTGYVTFEATITDSYSTGNAVGTSINVGGLIGYSAGSISNSYSTGSATGTEHVGGLIGFSQGEVHNCYATGSPTGPTSIGGLIGGIAGTTLTNSYWDITRTGQAVCCGEWTFAECYGKNSASSEPDAFYPKAGLGGDYNVPMQHNTVPANDWDFTTTWNDRDGNYPNLQ